MATQNALNNTTGSLTIDPGASGDSFVQFDINATGEFRLGVDDTDSDKLKISQGSALGTNDTYSLTSAGEMTMPLQPAFHAYLGGQDANVTGDGTWYVLGTNVAFTERFDQNADFNTNGTFTAPVTGTYFFHLFVRLSGITSSHTAGFPKFVGTPRDLQGIYCRPAAMVYEAGDIVTFGESAIFDLDAADTMHSEVIVQSGTKVVDVDGSASGNETVFSGYLMV